MTKFNGDSLAAEMSKILSDKSFKSIFASPEVKNDFESVVDQDPSYKAFVRIAKNESADKAAAFKHIVDSLATTSAALDNLGLEKSATVALSLLNGVLKEASSKFAQFAQFAQFDNDNELAKEEMERRVNKIDPNYGKSVPIPDSSQTVERVPSGMPQPITLDENAADFGDYSRLNPAHQTPHAVAKIVGKILGPNSAAYSYFKLQSMSPGHSEQKDHYKPQAAEELSSAEALSKFQSEMSGEYGTTYLHWLQSMLPPATKPEFTTRNVPGDESNFADDGWDGELYSYLDGAPKNAKDLDEDGWVKAIEGNAWLIQYIKNPTEKMQIAAVKENPRVLEVLKNPSKAVKDAVKSDSNAADVGDYSSIDKSPIAVAKEVRRILGENSPTFGYFYAQAMPPHMQDATPKSAYHNAAIHELNTEEAVKKFIADKGSTAGVNYVKFLLSMLEISSTRPDSSDGLVESPFNTHKAVEREKAQFADDKPLTKEEKEAKEHLDKMYEELKGKGLYEDPATVQSATVQSADDKPKLSPKEKEAEKHLNDMWKELEEKGLHSDPATKSAPAPKESSLKIKDKEVIALYNKVNEFLKS